MSDEIQSQVQVEHTFKASPERVFDAWLDPAIIRQWMFGSRVRDESVLQIRTDARVGGSFTFSVERDEQIIDHVGEYFIVDRPHRLVFTWKVEQNATESDHVIVDFRPHGSGCQVTLVHNLHPQRTEHDNDTLHDWPKMLSALENVLTGR